MPLVQRDRLLRAKPYAFVDPLRDVVVLDFSVSEVQTVAVGFEYIFVARHNGAARRRGIDPGCNRVRVVVGYRWIVFAERASARTVAVETRDVAAELNE